MMQLIVRMIFFRPLKKCLIRFLQMEQLWSNRVDKKKVSGIHGTLFFGEHCEDKRPFYPTKKESEMIASPQR